MQNPESIFTALHELGVGEFRHLNGALIDHLRGTADLLAQWQARPVLCAAGLYHAVYGTAGFNASVVDVNKRKDIAAIIGDEAEALVYLYGSTDRAVCYPRFGTSAQDLFSDRFTQLEYRLAPQQLKDLCELTVANELDIARGSAAFRHQYGDALNDLFNRMSGLLSAPCRQAYASVLGGKA